jgi:hypothetical protein
MKRRLKNAAKRLMHWTYRFGQRLGWDVLPRHFYSEIPDQRKLRRTTAWKQPYSMTGVTGWEVESQKQFVRSLVNPELVERLAQGDIHSTACRQNGAEGYGPIEAECLFAFVHTVRPQRIVQIGCGVSTAICLMAAKEAGYRLEITCVEPYPTEYLLALANAGAIQLIRSPAEDLTPEQVVGQLQAGDLFFVDSSHTLGPAGEVSRIILEFLPRVASGVYAHFHDIYFPYDYPGDLLSGALFFHHESALLHSFLVWNHRFRLHVSLSQLHHAEPDLLRSIFRNYQPRGNDHGLTTSPGHFPSSAFLQATA